MRDITDDFYNQLMAARVTPILLVDLEFDISIRLWNGDFDVVWNSNTYLGNGWLLGIDGGAETNDLSQQRAEISLVGVPQIMVSAILNSARQNSIATIYFGFLDSDNNIVDSPTAIFTGRLDIPRINETAEGALIQLNYESDLISLQKSKDYRYTTESQKLFNADDLGFQYVVASSVFQGFWGQTQAALKKKKKQQKNL